MIVFLMETKKQSKKAMQEDVLAARVLLEGTGLTLVDAARLAVELTEISGGARKVSSLRRIINLGGDELKKIRKTTSVHNLYQEFTRANEGLRSRTLEDYRQIMAKTAAHYPRFWKWRVRMISTEDIHEILDFVFTTPRQRLKARAVFHSLFSYAEKRRWTAQNPVTPIMSPRVKEQEIVPLSLPEIHRLLAAARAVGNGECLPAIAIMLFAGVRPQEVQRLNWSDIDLEENVIRISACHSKTGGARHVSVLKPLKKILSEFSLKINASLFSREPIAPANWKKRWKAVRTEAGWCKKYNKWRQDVLRHTFASYHAKYFKNYHLLQCEMGHGDVNLLRTRYISMSGITQLSAEQFWHGEVLGFSLPRVRFQLTSFPLQLCCFDENFRCENFAGTLQ